MVRIKVVFQLMIWYFYTNKKGLGKTIQSIALMVLNRPPQKQVGPTLIIAPLALIYQVKILFIYFQWRDEIIDKVEPNVFKVLIYHGTSRQKQVFKLAKYDVVLTTYGTMSAEFPSDKDDNKKKSIKTNVITIDGDTTEDEYSNSRNRGNTYLIIYSWPAI